MGPCSPPVPQVGGQWAATGGSTLQPFLSLTPLVQNLLSRPPSRHPSDGLGRPRFSSEGAQPEPRLQHPLTSEPPNISPLFFARLWDTADPHLVS